MTEMEKKLREIKIRLSDAQMRYRRVSQQKGVSSCRLAQMLTEIEALKRDAGLAD